MFDFGGIMNTTIIIEPLTTYTQSIHNALSKLDIQAIIGRQKAIMIKPNLVNGSPYPVTTPPECCEAIISYIRSFSDIPIVIAEGTGDASLETKDVFQSLGYQELSQKIGVPLIDLNHAKLTYLKDNTRKVFPEMYLPECVFEHYLISVPVLKAHSLSKLTGTLKNMMGIAPPKYYSGKYGVWKKAVFHNNMHESIIDLNQYRTPDLSVMDAGIGLPDYHLGEV
ncbi:MAG: iron-sulfur cluster-binding protein, partial [Candidatus Magnetoglobus multicellularis str. Araruama]